MGKLVLDITDVQVGNTSDKLDTEIAMDVNATFECMPNKRYVQVLQWMLVEGYDADEVATKLNTIVANVYNVKHRGIVYNA